jgi:hypothetical protein
MYTVCKIATLTKSAVFTLEDEKYKLSHHNTIEKRIKKLSFFYFYLPWNL